MGFRPALVPTLFVVGAVIVLVNLGAWQLRRHQVTSARIAHIEARLKQAPVDAAGLATSDAEALAWRLAEVRGTFLDVPPAFVTARFEFGRPGYDLVQPFQVDGGPLLLVNRGFLPSEDLERHLEETRPRGEVALRGLIRPVDGDPDAVPLPPNERHPERWRGPEYAAMAAAWGLEPAYVLVKGEALTHPSQKQADELPIDGFVARPRTRPHLEYAGTWFLVAVALVGLWIYAGVQRARREAEGDSERPAA